MTVARHGTNVTTGKHITHILDPSGAWNVVAVRPEDVEMGETTSDRPRPHPVEEIHPGEGEFSCPEEDGVGSRSVPIAGPGRYRHCPFCGAELEMPEEGDE